MKHTMRAHPVVALGLAAMIATVAAVRASDLPEVPYPQDFRSWHHVKSDIVEPEHASFPLRGGFHHFYANDVAMNGFRTGKFPNGSVLVDEGVATQAGEGNAKGITLEGERRSLDVMIKNDRLYKDNGGWGFEHFDHDSRTGAGDGRTRAQCAVCHAKARRDYVFSSVRP